MSRFKRVLAECAVLLGLLVCAEPLGAVVNQSGSVTPNHAACWTTTGVIKDCGSASTPVLTSIGTLGSGPTICANSGPATGAFNRICLSATATAGGVTMDNIGGATGGFTFTLNGTTQGMGTVTLPVTIGDAACFANTSGGLQDCGASPILTNLCTTSGAFPIYNATTAAWVCSTVGGTGSVVAYTSTNPNQIVAVETFAPAFTGGAGHNMIATWQTGATTNKDTTLRVQSIVTSTAPAGGAAGAGYFGVLNQFAGNDGYGVIGVVANGDAIVSGTGTGVWALVRRKTGISSTTVDGVRSTSEADAGQNPQSGLRVSNHLATNAFLDGAWFTSAVNYGVRVGVPLSSPEFVIPTKPFAFTTVAGDLFFIDNTGAGTFTKAAGYAVTGLSGAAGSYAAVGVGRTAVEANFLVGTANAIFPGVAAGDLVINTIGTTNRIWMGRFSSPTVVSMIHNANGTIEFPQYGTGLLHSSSTGVITSSAVVLTDLATQATNTVVGNATSGVAAPTALAVGTCSTAASALIWTTNTGFGCNTSITAAAAPASGLTGTTLASNIVTSSLTSLGTITSLTVTTISAHTLGGTISGGGNQINNVIIGTSTPLAGAFTTVTATTTVTSPVTLGGTGTGSSKVIQSTSGVGATDFVDFLLGNNGATRAMRILTDGKIIEAYTASIASIGGNEPQHQIHTGVYALGTYRWVNSTSGSSIVQNKSRGAAPGTRGIVSSGDIIGANYFAADDGTNFIYSAAMEALVDGTPGTNDMPARLVFSTTADGASSATERMRISSAGLITVTGTFAVTAMANTATTSAVCYNTGTGLFTYNSTVGTCTVSTLAAKMLDARLTPREGFDMVMAMEPWRYHMKKGLPTYQPGGQIGFVAEHVGDEALVARNPDGSAAGFRYEQYTAALTAAVQYLKADNDNLREEMRELKRAVGR